MPSAARTRRGCCARRSACGAISLSARKPWRSASSSAPRRLFDAEKRFTLSGDIGRLGECAAQVRSSLSAENWRALTVLQRDFGAPRLRGATRARRSIGLLLSLVALAGFALDDMTQDDGWRLMMIGRRLERLLFLSDVIARRLGAAATPLRQELEWLLEIGDSAITYRNRYRAPPGMGHSPSICWSTTSAIRARSPSSGAPSIPCSSRSPSRWARVRRTRCTSPSRS